MARPGGAKVSALGHGPLCERCEFHRGSRPHLPHQCRHGKPCDFQDAQPHEGLPRPRLVCRRCAARPIIQAPAITPEQARVMIALMRYAKDHTHSERNGDEDQIAVLGHSWCFLRGWLAAELEEPWAEAVVDLQVGP